MEIGTFQTEALSLYVCGKQPQLSNDKFCVTALKCSVARTPQDEPTIRCDTRCYSNVRSKADISQLNLPHGTKN